MPGLLSIFTFSVSVLRARPEEIIDFFSASVLRVSFSYGLSSSKSMPWLQKSRVFVVVSFPASRFV